MPNRPGGDDFEVPIRRQLGLRVEFVKAVGGEGGEILPQQGVYWVRVSSPNSA
jgi:hypothetical protein